MRICRITSEFVPPWRGLGPGPFELSVAQNDFGHEITVITKYKQGCEFFDKKNNFKIYRIRAKYNLVFSLIAAIKFIFLHMTKRFDLVHSHGESGLFLLFLKRVLRLKIPVISSVHIVRKAQYKILNEVGIHEQLNHFISKETPGRLAKICRRGLIYEKLYLNLSDALAVVDKSVAEQIEEGYGITKNINVISNGVNTDKFATNRSNSEQIEKIKNSMHCKYLLLFIGSLSGRKGEFDLIKTLQQIDNSCKGIKLLIIGDGPAKKNLVWQLEELNIRDKVKLIANVEPAELKRYYLASDLFVLPSYSEGLPKVLLEAMACGTPTVVSDIPAHKGLIEHNTNGYVFKTGDVDSLTSTIIHALNNFEAKKSLTSKAKKLIETDFTWQSVAERLDKVYQTVLNQK